MQLTTHPKAWVRYTYQPQSVVKSRRNQNGARTSLISNQPQEISSPELVTSQKRDVTRGIQPKFVY